MSCAFWKSQWLQCGGSTAERRGLSQGSQQENSYNRSGPYSIIAIVTEERDCMETYTKVELTL